MQRRLFFLFLLFSVVPAMVILAVNWQISQRNLDFLDSPGLQESLENSLVLAQERLANELLKVVQEARDLADSVSVAEEVWPEPSAGCGYVFFSEDGSKKTFGDLSDEFASTLQSRYPSHQQYPTRLSLGSENWLVAGVDLPAGRLVYARQLPVSLARQLDTIVQGSSRFRQLRFYYRDLLRTNTIVTLVVVAAVVLVVALLLSRRFAREIARPVKALARGTEQVAEGNLDVRIDVDARDELGNLVAAFNRMTADLKRSESELVRAERIAAWQGIARRLAHEIKNPLTPISLAMHRIESRSADPATADSVATVLEEVDNLKRLADEFSLYARLPEPNYEKADLNDLLHAVLELYIDPDRMTVDWQTAQGEERWLVRVDTGQIRQAVANLVKNAVHAMAGKGTLTVRLTRDTERITAAIRDTGPGLPDPAYQVFEPYFTTRSTGTGLGLAIARKIIEDHGGVLEAANAETGGAEFRVTLPAMSQETI